MLSELRSLHERTATRSRCCCMVWLAPQAVEAGSPASHRGEGAQCARRIAHDLCTSRRHDPQKVPGEKVHDDGMYIDLDFYMAHGTLRPEVVPPAADKGGVTVLSGAHCHTMYNQCRVLLMIGTWNCKSQLASDQNHSITNTNLSLSCMNQLTSTRT